MQLQSRLPPIAQVMADSTVYRNLNTACPQIAHIIGLLKGGSSQAGSVCCLADCLWLTLLSPRLRLQQVSCTVALALLVHFLDRIILYICMAGTSGEIRLQGMSCSTGISKYLLLHRFHHQ